MSPATALALAAVLLATVAAWELAGSIEGSLGAGPRRTLPVGVGRYTISVGDFARRLGVARRLREAGLDRSLGVPAILAAKALCTVCGALCATVIAPAAPGRLALLVAIGLPIAGFLAPDALLDRAARQRRRRLVAALPDAVDLLAVGVAIGRSPTTLLGEIAAVDEGPLAVELSRTIAELECGVPQRAALASLRERAPGPEIGAVVAALERSAKHGSPLADQLRQQASGLRGDQRRRIEERAAKAAPKIQLVVALILVPSVLAMIAAALLAHVDSLLVGF